MATNKKTSSEESKDPLNTLDKEVKVTVVSRKNYSIDILDIKGSTTRIAPYGKITLINPSPGVLNSFVKEGALRIVESKN